MLLAYLDVMFTHLIFGLSKNRSLIVLVLMTLKHACSFPRTAMTSHVWVGYFWEKNGSSIDLGVGVLTSEFGKFDPKNSAKGYILAKKRVKSASDSVEDLMVLKPVEPLGEVIRLLYQVVTEYVFVLQLRPQWKSYRSDHICCLFIHTSHHISVISVAKCFLVL